MVDSNCRKVKDALQLFYKLISLSYYSKSRTCNWDRNPFIHSIEYQEISGNFLSQGYQQIIDIALEFGIINFDHCFAKGYRNSDQYSRRTWIG